MASEVKPEVVLHPAPEIRLRDTDCNSPAHWDGDTLYVFNSVGQPYRSHGPDLFRIDTTGLAAKYDNDVNGARWIEATWRDDDGTLFGWYHNEPVSLIPEVKDRHLTAPRIGAAVSHDNGATWHDLGFILEEPANSLHRDTRNYYFAGGNGDFSVAVDHERRFIYLFISTYGDFAEQGVAIARMLFEDRTNPAGKVSKWRCGQWTQPGIGGRVTPIFPATKDWHKAEADAFWGPSVHWNTHLGLWVMLLNRAKDKDWTQEGIYVSYCRSLADPGGWYSPARIMDPPSRPGWYPQVIGSRKGETDKVASRTARLFVHGVSSREIEFKKTREN